MATNERRRAAIVTGGSRGIGRAVVERLARDGFDVALGYREREDAAQETVAAAEACGVRAVAVQTDLARAEDVAALFAAADDSFGRLDAVVLNAGALAMGPITEISEADFDWGFAVNVRSAFLAFREAARRLGDGGRVVTITTDLTRNPAEGTGAYAASKAALEVLTRTFARELGPTGITVNAVLPGLTETEGLVLPQPVIDALVAQTPLRRLGQPADVAEVVGFLLSPAAGWVTGQAICAGGGLSWT